MADYKKRSGKYRHVYGDLAKLDKQFLEIPSPLTSGEGSYVKASAKFFAFAGASVQKLYVRKLDNPGRLGKSAYCVSLDCIKGKVWDFDFSPFQDNMIAMGDDNGKVAVATVPMEGLKANLTTPTVDLGVVHGKKVALVEFHPTAQSILATGSFDRTVKISNIETQSVVADYKKLGDNIYSLLWNKDGSRLAVSGKDKKIRMFDPRNMDDTAQEINAFDGAKSSKVFWVSRLGWIGATGFNKQAKRQLKMWDLRKLGKPIYSLGIDQASSVLMPMWDDDNGLLYMPGKGEGTVQFGEIVNDSKKYYNLGMYRHSDPQKGGGWVPKRGLDVWKCEVQRFLKLTSKDIRPISFIVPRKAGADVFQEDIYPDCVSAKPAMSADEYLNGNNKDPNRMTLDPKKRSDDDSATTAFKRKRTYAELATENAKLRKYIAELEARVAGGGGAPPQAVPESAPEVKEDPVPVAEPPAAEEPAPEEPAPETPAEEPAPETPAEEPAAEPAADATEDTEAPAEAPADAGADETAAAEDAGADAPDAAEDAPAEAPAEEAGDAGDAAGDAPEAEATEEAADAGADATGDAPAAEDAGDAADAGDAPAEE